MATLRSADYKAPEGKLVRVRLTEENGEILSLRLSGDFFLVPEENLGKLEKMLIGAPLREPELQMLVDRFFNATRVQSLGVTRVDLVKALLAAREGPDY